MFKCSGISDSASVRLRAESKRPITPRWSRQPWGEPAELYLPKFGHLVLFKMPLSVEPSACSSACQARLWAQHTPNYRATHKSTMAAFVAGLAAGLVEHIPERRSGCWGARNYLWNEATRTCSDFPFCPHCWLSVLHFGLFPLLMPRLQRWWASGLWYCCSSLQVKIKLLIVWLSRSCLCTQCFRTVSSFCHWFLKPSQP